MFEKNTVFILGAGASWHYNYPTGENLVREVVLKTKELITLLNKPRSQVIGSDNLEAFLSEKFEDYITGGNVVEFLENFTGRLKHVDPPVIDYFLEWNEDLRDIGRMMIAWVILDREREYEEKRCNENQQRLRDEDPLWDPNRRSLDCKKFYDNWYRFILYKMLSGCRASEQVADNKVNFVTFNYDVSLESYLYKGLKQISFMKSGKLYGDIVKDILQDRFFHMYGSIRENPFVDPVPVIKNARDFYSDLNQLYSVYKSSSEISTIGNNKDNGSIEARAQKVIQTAEEVYILGFGFDPYNCQRLNLKELLSYRSVYVKPGTSETIERKVNFTNFGDINTINKKASKLFVGNERAFLKDYIYDRGRNSQGDVHIYEKSTRNVYDALANDFGLLE